jgi:general stress protein YciG
MSQKKGFAAMDPKLVRELARKGGKAAQAMGVAHQFTSEEARAAGRKGGLATRAKSARERIWPRCNSLTCRRCHGNPGNDYECGPNAPAKE